MLIQLEIKNFAIIEHSIINFEKGFNVITGETGAGKSIIMDALSSIVGERTSKGFVRRGEEKAELQAVFVRTETIDNRLKEKNIHIDDDVIIIRRTITNTGRSIAKINGSIQTTQVIKDICVELVEICGQKAHLDLLREDKYLHWIDAHAKTNDNNLRLYKTTYKKYKEIEKALEDLQSEEREKEQLLDLYKFQQKEIENLNVEVGEDERLEEEKRFLNGFEKVSTNVVKAINMLGSIEDIFNAKESLKTASKYDESLLNVIERMEKAFYELQDARGEIENYLGNVEYDEERLNEIMYRLDGINQIKRKYADTIEGILKHYDMVSKKIDDIDNKEERVKELEKEKKFLLKELETSSQILHVNRKELAGELQQRISNELKELCMPDATFVFDVLEAKEFNRYGKTDIQILFNANKGEELQSLPKVASGGELSRVLLAMKIAGNAFEETPTLIFDEVDEGIGGEVGRVIGQKLRELSEGTQVVVISHLPQVAAKADVHLLIKKFTKEDRTVSNVAILSDEERKDEIARMIYGDEKNETTLKQAEEMLNKTTK